MAKSTKNTYKPSRMGNYKPVVRMENGGNVSELNYSERSEYIEENYAPFITDAQMIFSVYGSNIEYDYKANRKEVVNKIIEEYQSLGDYSEKTLPQETIYEIQDWDLVRREIDPDTDEVIGETSLEEVSADNTYNFSYLGLVDLNWRVYHDEEYDRFFYVIMPHLGGDIRGNYGEAIILEGDDKEELFYRFYENFISGNASVYLKFTDGSEIAFDSEQDSDVFTFRVSEISEPTGMAQKYLNDFEKFDSWKGDEFLEETVDIYLMRQGVAPKMMAGGSLNDETPKAYIQILGYDEGKWMNISDYSNGEDVIDAISDYMKELNKQFGGNREEYEVADYEGFGDDLFDQYMGANEFDEIIDGYEKYQNSDFPADVITAYKNDSGSRNDSLSNVIDEMDNNFFGKYNNFSDFGYEMVEQGVYEPSDRDVYVTDTDKRILAGEEADAVVDNMSFDDLLDKAQDVKSEYEDEKSELEDKISTIQSEIDDLSELQKDSENDDEYEKMSELIEEKEIELDDTQSELDDIDSRYEDKAREEAQELFYDEIYDKLQNDLSSWLDEYGYTDNLQDLSFLSVDYEQIGNEIASDYLMVDFDGEIYFFNNYKKGGRIMASKRKPKYAYYIVENSTKKLVSGYGTKAEATEQRKLLVQQYPAMRFEIYPLANLESKTNLDVYAKKDYVELSTLDKIKKVSVDAYRYGEEKVGQANLFLEKHDVKGKINRGARNVAYKTKQGANFLRNQWLEADFGDGKGKAKFFDDGGIAKLDDFIKREDIIREHSFFIVDKNGKRLEDWARSGDNILRHQEDWENGHNMSWDDVVTESILKENGVNPNDVVSIVVYDLTKGEQIFNGSQLSDKEWYDYIKFLKEDTYEEYAKGGGVDEIEKIIDHDFNNINGFTKDPVYKKGNVLIQRIGGSSMWSVAIDNKPKGRILDALTQEQAFKKVEKEKFADGGGVGKYGANWIEESLIDFYKSTEKRLGKKGAFIKVLQDARFENIEGTPKNNFKHKRLNKIAVVTENEVFLSSYTPNTDRFLHSNKFDDVKKLGDYLDNNKIYSNGGRVKEDISWDVTFYDRDNSETFEVNVRGYFDNEEDAIKRAIYENNVFVDDTQYGKMYWGESEVYVYGAKRNYADGGMAGLSDVSAMLPNPLPMSTIVPMANGGDVKDFSDNQLMIMNQNVELEHHHEELEDILKDETPVPAWAVSKMATATESISDVTHYLDGQSKMADGGEANEIKYLENRIKNLKELLAVSNKDEKEEMIETIQQLEKDKEKILNKTNKPEEIKDKKSFWLFKKGGLTELPKDKSKIHFTDNEGREYDGIFFKDEDMFYIGFEEKGDFRYIFEVVQWNYLDGENDDDAHKKHEASETAEEEKAEHQYDVYDNKRMLENQAHEIEHHSEELNSQVKITKRVPAWVIAKTERATTDLSDVTHYLDGENKMAYGGELGDVNYEIIPLPSSKKFIIVQVTNLGNDKEDENIIRDFNANPMKFDDINSAQKFIDNVIIKYPFGVQKANVGAILMASQLLQQQQPQQPQVVYYVPQEEPQEEQNTGITQNIPEMASGGEVDSIEINDFCITNLIDLANDLQSVKYFTTDRFKEKDVKLEHYKGTLAIVFKEPASVSTVKAINKFIERAEDCHHLFEQSVNVSGSQPNSLSINLLSDKYSDREFKKGGKVYENTPKKINIEKTKKINTILGEYILSLITKDFVYFVNSNEGDENAQTIMYNKKGELLSDNIHATNDLFETLDTQDDFEFIHPDMEAYRQEILKGN
jgi:hypothetical protein